MALDLIPPPEGAALIAPHQIDRRNRHRGRTAAIVVGTVLILSDGSECVVAGFDAQGNPLCYPAQP